MFIASSFKSRSDQGIAPIAYGRDEFIQNCAYNTKPCFVERDFKHKADPIYGSCYTFNDGDKSKGEKVYQSTRAGPLYGFTLPSRWLTPIASLLPGLRLLLKSNQSEYLPLTESAGVRVAVHGQGEEPFPDAFGYNAAAGFTTSFGIKFVRLKSQSEDEHSQLG